MNMQSWCAMLMGIALVGCAAVPERGGEDVATRCGDVGSAAARLDPTYVRECGAAAGQAAWLAQPLTAERALQAALAQNHEVQAELAKLDAIEAERVQAGLLRNPMLNLMLLRPEGGGRFALEAGWMQSLFDLLTRSRRIDLADATARRERAGVSARLLEVGWSAQSAFYEAVTAEQRAQLLEQEIALDTQALDLQARLTARGLAAQSELLAMQAMQDERRHMRHEMDAERIDTRAMLAERIGLASGKGLQLPADFVLPALPAEDELAWQQRALGQRPELAATAAAVAVADAERALETGVLSNTEPEVGLQVERDAEGMRMFGPELRIALPLFDEGSARADRIDAMRREAVHADEAQRRMVLLAVERAFELLVVGADRLAAVETHLARTREADALAARQHRNGSIDLMMRIDAQRAVLAAERQRLDARLVLARAHVALQRAVGSAI